MHFGVVAPFFFYASLVFPVVTLGQFLFARGTSLVLYSDALVRERFGREVARARLRDFIGGTDVAGVPALKFASQTFILNGDHPGLFLDAVKEAAAKAGVIEHVEQAADGPNSAWFHVRRTRFAPDVCARCGASAVHHKSTLIERGFSLLFLAVTQFAEITVPLCRKHATQRQVLGATIAVLPWLLLVSSLFVPLLVPRDLSRVPIILYFCFSLVLVLASANFGSSLADWVVCRFRFGRLSEDQSGARLYVADSRILDRLEMLCDTDEAEDILGQS